MPKHFDKPRATSQTPSRFSFLLLLDFLLCHSDRLLLGRPYFGRVFDVPCPAMFLGQIHETFPVLFKVLCFDCSFRGFPGFHVLSENLPDFFLLAFTVQDNLSFVPDIFQHSEAVGQVRPGYLVHFNLASYVLPPVSTVNHIVLWCLCSFSAKMFFFHCFRLDMVDQMFRMG